MGLFNPGYEDFAETAFTVRFRSFLKAHAKAKNEAGFGVKLEKGQTIAAGSEAYNSRFTTINRQLVHSLQQVMCDDMILDIGLSDVDFSKRSQDLQLYSEENTQIDIKSQDSVHRESHVIAFLIIAAMYTDITPEESEIYYHMRSKFVVQAKSYSTDNRIKFEQSWTLPSGDPMTLIANCLHEMTSTAYIFKFRIRNRPKGAAKGDDQYYSAIVRMTNAARLRAEFLGIQFKIDYCLPPFFAGRFLAPDSSAWPDPIKSAAKYSIKSFAPELYPEYCQAYKVLLPTPNVVIRSFLENSALAHHPTMNLHHIQVLFTFAYSLWHQPFFQYYQKKNAYAPRQMIDVGTNCSAVILRKLQLPRMQTPSIPLLFLNHLDNHKQKYIYIRYASRATLLALAREHPEIPIISREHTVIYTNSTF
jgi:hypothetical protein